MDNRHLNLLDEALALDDQSKPWPLTGQVLLVEDCVETSGAFVLHHLVKRSLSPVYSSNAVIFVAFSQPFAHYDRVLRKLGCNLVAQRENGRFIFFDMLMLECPDENGGKTSEEGLVGLYSKIHKAVSVLLKDNKSRVVIMIDDISLMEVAANGWSNHVIDFLHYCHTLTSKFGCSFIALNHKDIYLSTEKPSLNLQMEYLADILLRAEPLATGLATDVHGQLTVLNKQIGHVQERSRNRTANFHFKVKENIVEYFFPGSRV